MSSFLDLLDIPKGEFIMIMGPSGGGKSTFTCRSQLHQLLDRTGGCLSVVTDQSPASMRRYLGQLDGRFADRERNLPMNYVDAFRRTVGLKAEGEGVSCGDLTSLGLAISQALKEFNRSDVLVTLDSLTPVYILNGSTTTRFVQTVLAKYAAEGFSVLATVDEAVTKAEDVAALTSMATGVLRIRRDVDQSFIDIVKHPTARQSGIKFPITYKSWMKSRLDQLVQRPEAFRTHYLAVLKTKCRTRMPDYVHFLWLQLPIWGGMLWDPKRFPSLTYDIMRDLQYQAINVSNRMRPWIGRLFTRVMLRLFDVSKVRSVSLMAKPVANEFRKNGVSVFKYMKDKSKYGEHHGEHTEVALAWGLPNVGRRLCFAMSASAAGYFTALDRSGSDWSCYEAQCVGEGAQYCEFVNVKGHSAELERYLSGFEYSEVEPILRSLMQRSVSLALEGKDEMVRSSLGSDVHLWLFQDLTSVLALCDERYMVAMRYSGVHLGRWLAKELLNRGVAKQEASKYLVNFLNSVKAGEVVMRDTIKIHDCAEAAGLDIGEHVCFFTTGFLSGFLEESDARRVAKTRCVGAGDDFCEWTY